MVDKVPVSDLCDEYKLQPSVYYDWQRQVFDNLAVAFAPADGREAKKRERELAQQVQTLQARLANKDSVIAEVAEEMVKLKKELGEP